MIIGYATQNRYLEFAIKNLRLYIIANDRLIDTIKHKFSENEDIKNILRIRDKYTLNAIRGDQSKNKMLRDIFYNFLNMYESQEIVKTRLYRLLSNNRKDIKLINKLKTQLVEYYSVKEITKEYKIDIFKFEEFMSNDILDGYSVIGFDLFLLAILLRIDAMTLDKYLDEPKDREVS